MLKGIIDLTEKAGYQPLEIMGVMDLDDKDCERLEEAMECFLNEISIMEEDEVENEEAGW